MEADCFAERILMARIFAYTKALPTMMEKFAFHPPSLEVADDYNKMLRSVAQLVGESLPPAIGVSGETPDCKYPELLLYAEQLYQVMVVYIDEVDSGRRESHAKRTRTFKA